VAGFHANNLGRKVCGPYAVDECLEEPSSDSLDHLSKDQVWIYAFSPWSLLNALGPCSLRRFFYDVPCSALRRVHLYHPEILSLFRQYRM
jgi:hypothetical protein